MENFDFKHYRNSLAETLKKSPKAKRNEILDTVQETEEYQHARMLKIESVKKHQDDVEKMQMQQEKLGLKPEKIKLGEISKENIQRLKAGFVLSAIEKGMFFSEEEALEAIKNEKNLVENTMALTVNLTPQSVARFFEKEKQDTLWDHLREAGSLERMKRGPTTQSKELHSQYIQYRKTAEDALSQFVPEEHRGKKPVYAALAGGTGSDLVRGACPQYGNVFLELDMSELNVSALNFNDSFANVHRNNDEIYQFDHSSLLSVDDAEEAKAIVNLMGKYNDQFPTTGGMVKGEDLEKILRIDGKTSGYVEVAVFDDIVPDKVERVSVSLVFEEDVDSIGTLLQYPKLREKFHFFISKKNAVGGLTFSWLVANFKDRVHFDEVPDDAGDLWNELGLESLASYEEVKNAIQNKCEELWKQMRFRIGMDTHSKPGYSQVAMIKGNKWKWKNNPELIRKTELYSRLEKERLFFN